MVSHRRMSAGVKMSWELAVYVVGTFGLVGLMLGASYLLGGRDHGRAKDEPFESGAVSVGGAQLRMPANSTSWRCSS